MQVSGERRGLLGAIQHTDAYGKARIDAAACSHVWGRAAMYGGVCRWVRVCAVEWLSACMRCGGSARTGSLASPARPCPLA